MKKYFSKKLKDPFLILFLIAIFFFKIPNFYFIPFFSSPFLTTQALARILLILIFFIKVIQKLKKKTLTFPTESRITITFIILFFVIQSLSVFSAINVVAFLSRYKDIVLGIFSLFIFYFFKDHWKKIVLVYIAAGALNLIYQSLMVIYPDFSRQLINTFIYKNHADLVLADMDRRRLYTDTYDEIIIPFLFFPYIKNVLGNSISNALIIFIGIISFLSNFRSRTLMFLISIFSSVLIIGKINFGKIVFYTLFILFIGYSVGLVQKYTGTIIFYERIASPDSPENVSSITSRISQVQQSIIMGKSSLLGVGLGNYFDNSTNTKVSPQLPKLQKVETIRAQEYVHNVFASTISESGYFSLVVFLIILALFIKRDIKLLKTGRDHEKAFIISFWSLFSYGVFNPTVPGSYQVLYWGLRGLLL